MEFQIRFTIWISLEKNFGAIDNWVLNVLANRLFRLLVLVQLGRQIHQHPLALHEVLRLIHASLEALGCCKIEEGKRFLLVSEQFADGAVLLKVVFQNF